MRWWQARVPAADSAQFRHGKNAGPRRPPPAAAASRQPERGSGRL